MAKGKVLQTVVDIAGEISPTLGKALGEVEKQLDGVNVKALAAGAAVAGIAVAVGAAVVKSIDYLADLGDTYNSAVNDIAAGTGLVGDELEGMSDVLKDVYGSNFGESMEDAAAGITAVYQATGLTEDALAETTKAAYALSDTFGYDIAESARAAKAMMTNFGISGEEAMGLIAAGAQNGLDYSGEMIDSINEYSVQFAKLGFTADDMFQIFQQGADSGAWNLDKVGDAVKEFSIRSIDGSETTKHAFTALGLNAEEMMAMFAAGGDEAAAGFQGVIAALMSVEDQVLRDQLGVELFGTQWEDLGVEALAAMGEVKKGAYDTEDALAKINAVKYDNIGDAMEGIKRQAEVSLLPLASTVANVFTELAPFIGEMFAELGPIIEEVTALATPFISEFLVGAKDAAKKLMPLISNLAEKLLPVIVNVIDSIFTAIEPLIPIFTNLITALLPTIISLVQMLTPVITMVVSALSPVVGLIAQLVSALLPPLTSLFTALTPVIQTLADIFSSVLGNAISSITPMLEGITTVLGGIIDFITNVFSGNWEDAWNGIIEVFKGIINLLPQGLESVINGVIDLINGLIDGINSVSGIVGATIPHIPHVDIPDFFAAGGFTDGLGIVGEDPRYPTEAVISFNPAYRDENLSYWAQAGRMLGAEPADFLLGGGGGGSSVVELGGVTFAPNITITGVADKETIMQVIEAEYPEFFDLLDEYLAERGQTVYA